jgi:CPA2 family monovalent cation:H+ antiporter-2
MNHLPKLIEDLALILVAAGVVTVLFRRIRQPVVLGYILAGFLVGPHFNLVPTIMDQASLNVWGEIGVIFLLFTLGLEFSFRKLMKVGAAAVVTAVVEVSTMVAIGTTAGHLLGWSGLNSLFLGGVLAISSTSIIIRAFEELGVKSKGFASLVFGVLVVEDLAAVLILVLLSTLAVTKQFDGMGMIYSTLKLGFFLVLWFLGGIFLLPSFFRRMRRQLNEETLLILGLGLCFMMVVLATRAGFSAAVGAFMMGSILAETTEAERFEKLLHPVRDLFAAVFFVSVGMMIDPHILRDHAGIVALLTALVLFGKITGTTIGALLSGQSLRYAMRSGMSLAQIGEFSFIIAALGLSLKVTDDMLYPVAVSVSALTTFFAPYLIRLSEPAVQMTERLLPETWLQALAEYATSTHTVAHRAEWKAVLRAYATLVVSNLVIVISVFLLLAHFLPRLLAEYLGDGHMGAVAALAVALLATSPFVWAMLSLRPRREEASQLWNERSYRSSMLVLEVLRFIVVWGTLGVLSAQFIGWGASLAVIFLAMTAALFVLSRHLGATYRWFEHRFVENLTARETQETAGRPQLAPWDAHIARLDVEPESEAAGKALDEIKVRERFGVTVALIERGRKALTAPMGHERLLPGDRLSVIGTDEQIESFRSYLAPAGGETQEQQERPLNYRLHRIHIGRASQFAHKNIRESSIREQIHGLVVGVERDGERILNPDSSWVIKPGDDLWIVADSTKIRQTFENQGS